MKAPFQREEEAQAIHLNGLIADFVINADALSKVKCGDRDSL